MINLIVVHSIIEDPETVSQRTSEDVSEILKSSNKIQLKGTIKNTDELELFFNDKDESLLGTVLLNTSGGTEAIIQKIAEHTNKPVLILADSNKNSFASSLESYAYLKERYKIKIFYSDDISKKVNAAKSFSIALTALKEVNESHFCLMGDPSDWLLTSQKFTDFSPFDTKFSKISIDQINNKVSEIADEQTDEIIEGWKNNYNEIVVENRSLIDSVKVYKALKNIIDENNADVISVRCFDLLEHNYTACMGLSICNDEGITAGCEGDIPATFTMLIAQKLSGQPVWMANPASINMEMNQIVFAHCTAPSKFFSDVNLAGLTTHMESGLSTAIRGPLNKSEVTILRIGNDFKKIVAVTGRIIESDMKNVNLCRTQAVIKINGSVEEWIGAALGNHQVIVYGNILPMLEYFCEFSGIEFIKI